MPTAWAAWAGVPVGEFAWHFAQGSPPMAAKVWPHGGVVDVAMLAVMPLLWQYTPLHVLVTELYDAVVLFFDFSAPAPVRTICTEPSAWLARLVGWQLPHPKSYAACVLPTAVLPYEVAAEATWTAWEPLVGSDGWQ